MAEEKKKNWFLRHKILAGVIAIALVAAIASGGGKSDSNKTTSSNSPKNSSQSSKPQVAKIGEAARDGKFEFTVKSFKCGEATVGSNPYLQKTAQGQFCALSLTVKNIANEKQTLFSTNQNLLNGETKYSADDTATMYATNDSSSWMSDINPGNSVEGKIYFDVPKDANPTLAELHDSSMSGGVKVNLQ